MSNQPPEPQLPKNEVDELRQEMREALGELQARLEELREASTPAEKKEARADIAEARADLDALAKSAGVSRAALERAMDEAKKAERREELRPILAELLDEREAVAAEPEPAPKPPKPAKAGANPVEPEPAPKPDDSAPEHPHWSERPLSELLR